MATKKKSSQSARKKATPKAKSKPAKKSSKPAKKKKTRPAPTIGRAKITGEEQLFMLFHEDFHSRQVFDFLRVQTVKELEQYSPQQIVKLLSKPITDTVNRIRRKLAEKNRYLLDDIDFAIEFNEKTRE